MIGLEKYKESLRKVFNNNYTLGFSLIGFLILIIILLRELNLTPGGTFFNNLSQAFSNNMLLLLLLSFIFSAVLAHYKKFKWMFLPLVIWLLINTAVVRTSNIDQLKDVTTGDYTLGPDLDPFLYLRHAQGIEAGTLQSIDPFVQAPLGSENYAYTNLMSWSLVAVHKIINIFGDYSLTYAAIISPVIFFIISLIGFMLFMKIVLSGKFSQNKVWITTIIAGILYASMPGMLHRTTAGIPEIESLGMMWFWFAFLFFTLAWKEEKSKKQILWGVLAGIFTIFMSWTWGGYKYIYLTFWLTTLVIFLFEKDRIKNFRIYLSWLITSLTGMFIKNAVIGVYRLDFLFASIGDVTISFFVGAVLIVDYLLFTKGLDKKINFKKINLPTSIKSIIITTIFAIAFLLFYNPEILTNSFSSIIRSILRPTGIGRIGVTVAENKAPYFIDVFENFKYLFWTFFLGMFLIFFSLTRHFSKKTKFMLNFSFILFSSLFVFSRYSPSSIFNGDSLLSKFLALGSLIFFTVILGYVFIKAYHKKNEKTIEDFKNLDVSYLILVIFCFLGLISFRGTIRLFFIVSPIIVIGTSFLIMKFLSYKKEDLNDDLKKFGVRLILILIVILVCWMFFNFASATSYEAKSTIPSYYNQQWQRAMGWVRENTSEGSIFVHWWDYGYWVQSLGERPTVTDGGHINGWWDHMTARYLLTTPYPKAALSLMKSYNVSYLLIDSTDLGKYSAYSSIGSDSTGNDRLSWIPVIVNDPRQTQETQNSTLRVYGGGFSLDKDIVYHQDGKEIFLPAGGAGIAGIILETSNNKENFSLKQPIGVYVYNNQQFRLPIKNLYINDELIQYEGGIDATLRVIPSLEQSGSRMVINQMGAIIYLSEKTQESLFSKLYLMDDPLKEYPTIELAHVEPAPIVSSLKSQGANVEDFVYYQGFQGPIKIWGVEYPQNIETHEEFLGTSGEYGGLDHFFVE